MHNHNCDALQLGDTLHIDPTTQTKLLNLYSRASGINLQDIEGIAALSDELWQTMETEVTKPHRRETELRESETEYGARIADLTRRNQLAHAERLFEYAKGWLIGDRRDYWSMIVSAELAAINKIWDNIPEFEG